MWYVVTPEEGKANASDNGAYKYYVKKAKFRNIENTSKPYIFSKIVNSFYAKIARDMVDNDGGVFIKGLGYFTILKHPKKMALPTPYQGGKTYFNSNTNNHLFMPVFIGVAKGEPLLNFWTMDRTFSRVMVKSKLHLALKAGKKYKTFISTLASLYLFNKKNYEH